LELDFQLTIRHDPEEKFRLDERHWGRLLLAKELDADGPDGGVILINLEARASTAYQQKYPHCPPVEYSQVLIRLVDLNDNAPRFTQPSMEISVAENHPIHQPFYLVKAIDKDRGEENGRVGYELVSTEPVGCPVQVYWSGIYSELAA
jgi:hypothetical protein